jgi:hypothetical protein
MLIKDRYVVCKYVKLTVLEMGLMDRETHLDVDTAEGLAAEYVYVCGGGVIYRRRRYIYRRR